MRPFSYGIIPYLFTDKGVSIMVSKSWEGDEYYNFIKGKIEIGETEKECCKREVKEEIGVDISTDDLEELFIQKNPKKNIGLYLINWDKYGDNTIILDTNEIYSLEWFNVKYLPLVSKNQRLILTDIQLRFDKINYLNRRRNV